MKNKILFYLLTIILIIAFSSAYVLATTELSIEPLNKVVSYNDEFVVSVYVNSDDSIAGATLNVNFDSNILEAVSVVEGGFLSQDSDSVLDVGNDIDNTAGKVTFSMIIITPFKGLNGSGYLANITFRAIRKNDNSDVTIDNILLANSLGNQVNASAINNGSVTIATIQNIVINEFLVHPSSGSEWIEIYNNNSETIDLSSWTINDTLASPSVIVTIPPTTLIQPNSHLIFYVSNKLNNGGDGIKLIDDEGALIDEHTYLSDPGGDISIGRRRDGLDEWISFNIPTPNATNNRVPTGTIDDQPIDEDVPDYFIVTDYITDDDNDPLTFTIVDENVSKVDCNIINETNVTMTPATHWNGVSNCTIEVDDGYGTVDKLFNINVNAINDAPTISGVPDQSATEDVALVLNMTPYIDDVDGNIPSLVVTENSDYATVNGQTITFNYPNGILEENVTITVSDGSLTDEQQIAVSITAVNDAPTISGVPDQNAVEDISLILNLTPYINDVDDDISSLIITENSDYATVNGQVITFNYPNGILEENVTITVSDGSLTDEQIVKVTITPVNDAPVIDSSISPINFLEGEYKIINLSDYVSDIDNLDGKIGWSEASSSNLTIDIDNTNKIMNVSALPTWYGSEIFSLTADDGGLGGTDTEEITVNVQSILSLSELIVTIDGVDYSSIDNGDTVGPASPDSSVSLSVKINNNYPSANQWVQTVVLTGRIDSTIDDTTSTSLPFTLNGAKSTTKQLIFNNLPLTIDEGAYTLTLTANGTDYKGVVREISWVVYINYVTENNDVRILDSALIYGNLSCYRETDLNVTLVNTGETLQYVNITISNNDLGVYESQIMPIGAKNQDSVISTVSLVNAPDAGTYPINVKIRYDDGEGGYITKETNADLIINDCFDVENKGMGEDSTTPITINLYDYVDDPVIADADFIYDIEDETNTALIDCELTASVITCANPAADQNGYSDITLSVTNDSFVNYDVFRLSVNPVNDAPVAYGVSTETDEDNSVVIEFNCSDMDGDSLSYIIVDNPEHGALSGSGDSRTYTPDTNYNGDDSFTYKCNDGVVDSNVSDVDVNIISIIDEPSITSFSPNYNPLIGDGVEQGFSITIADPDNANPVIRWYVDDGLKESGTDVFSWSADDDFTVKVNITNSTINNEHEWDIDVSKVPVTDDYDGTINDVTEDNVGNFTGLTIYNSFGKIDFRNQTIDLSDVVDVDNNFRIESGIVGINSDAPGFNVFKNHFATITMYGLTSPSTPTIYYNNGFDVSGTNVCTGSTNPACTNIEYNATTGTLIFDVSHFTIFFLNLAPTITSSPVTTAILDEEYRYDVEASDPENDVLTYSLTQKPSGMTINSNTGLISWVPINLTTENVTLSVSDSTNTVTQSFSITVKEGARLRISDLDVKVGKETDKDIQNGDKIGEEAKPGDNIKFDIEIENMFSSSSDMKIEDIEIVVTIKDIDDGDDLEEEETIDEIDAGDDDSVSIEFEIPTLVKEDIYDVIIEVDGEDEDGGDHGVRWELTLEVKKDKHDVIIDDLDLNPSLIRCNREPILSVNIVNIGREDEDDVSIEITNSQLDIDESEENIDLEEGNDEDAEYEQTFRLSIGDDVDEGTYPISVKVYFDSKLADEETVNLIAQDCIEIITPVEEEAPEVEVITTTPTTKPVTPVTKISFRETSEYLTLLVILFIILGGAVIFLFGAAVILMRRR